MGNLDGTFWQAATERAIKTALQVAIPLLALAFTSAGDLIGADWADFATVVGGAFIMSYATSVVSAIPDGNPSVGSREVAVDHSATVADERLAQ